MHNNEQSKKKKDKTLNKRKTGSTENDHLNEIVVYLVKYLYLMVVQNVIMIIKNILVLLILAWVVMQKMMIMIMIYFRTNETFSKINYVSRGYTN